MKYHAEGNVVYNEDGDVACVVATVSFRKWVGRDMAQLIAEVMSDDDHVDHRGAMVGTLH